MIKKGLILIVDGDGTLLSQPIGRLQANAQFSDGITVITPIDLKDVVSITFSRRNRIDEDVTQYLIPNGRLKGKDILPEEHHLYQKAHNWNVFQNDVNSLALSYVAKYRGGILFASVSAGVQVLPHHAVNYKGVFGINNPLPTEELEDGDYYVCNTFNYFEQDILWTLDDIAYYKDEQWHKSNYRGIFGTETFEIPVSPNIKANVEVESDLDLAILLAGRVAVNEVSIIALDGRMTQAEEDIIDRVKRSGDTMLGDLNFNSHNIDNISVIRGFGQYIDILTSLNMTNQSIKNISQLESITFLVDYVKSLNGLVVKVLNNLDLDGNKIDNVSELKVGSIASLGGEIEVDGNFKMTGHKVVGSGDVNVETDNTTLPNSRSVRTYATPLSRMIADGLDLRNDITSAELTSYILTATQSRAGLMTPQDKQNIQTMLDLLEDDPEGTINTIKEIFEVFEGFSDDVALIDILNAKVNMSAEINGKTIAQLISGGLWAEDVKFSSTNVGAELIRLALEKIDISDTADLMSNEDKAKLDKILENGDTNKFLNAELLYKVIKANQVKTSEHGFYEGKGVEEALDYIKALTGLIIIDLGTFEDYDYDEPLDIGIFTGNTQETDEYTPLMAEMFYDEEEDNLIIGTGDGKKERLVDA